MLGIRIRDSLVMESNSTSSTLPRSRRALYGITDWALLFAGLANLAVGTFSALNDSAAIAATSLTAGLVLLFAATIDRFESLKGLGIEAKTKQLDQKINQADDALRRLREMTEITGAALIDLNSKMGRWDSVPGPRESIAFADRVRQTMKNLGSSDDVIASVLRPWAKTLCFDMALAQTHELRRLLQARLSSLEAERQTIKQPIQPDDSLYSQLSAQIRSIQQFQSSRLKDLHRLELEDYPHRFMEVFDDVPQIEPAEVDNLRKAAGRYAPGMSSLVEFRALPDAELWIDALSKARDR
ncbi:MAG TPA: hypothetical protein PLX20_15060 [Rhodocyclaceae bacterium]|nr:hypothetical protein [Rhodocyclaceae bacterium]HNH14455.1 hypothetical protein [Rhodocyclaceae bacterium]